MFFTTLSFYRQFGSSIFGKLAAACSCSKCKAECRCLRIFRSKGSYNAQLPGSFRPPRKGFQMLEDLKQSMKHQFVWRREPTENER
jgi:hypothetical protein